jgi:hypothetical protein
VPVACRYLVASLAYTLIGDLPPLVHALSC